MCSPCSCQTGTGMSELLWGGGGGAEVEAQKGCQHHAPPLAPGATLGQTEGGTSSSEQGDPPQTAGEQQEALLPQTG